MLREVLFSNKQYWLYEPLTEPYARFRVLEAVGEILEMLRDESETFIGLGVGVTEGTDIGVTVEVVGECVAEAWDVVPEASEVLEASAELAEEVSPAVLEDELA